MPVKPQSLKTADSRIRPQLSDLMALSRPAQSLPSWTRSIRAPQGGLYLSSFKGRGMEYDESRPYQPGDDIRAFDWRVTARTGKPHTKLFREERERPVFVFVDYRSAMFFATQGIFKCVFAAHAASLIAWRAMQNGDRIGGLVFSEEEHHEILPVRSTPAVIRLVKALVAGGAEPSARVADLQAKALTNAMQRLRRIARPGSLIFMFSDFRHIDDAARAEISRLAQHSDVMTTLIYDPFESELPDEDTVARVSDGQREVDVSLGVSDKREAYRARFIEHVDAMQTFCTSAGVLFGRASTLDDPLQVLQRMLRRH